MTNKYIETKLYGGSVTIKFFPDPDHLYFANGEEVHGVTSMVGMKDKSKALVSWALEIYRDKLLEKFPNLTVKDIEKLMNAHKDEQKESQSTGTDAHYWCENYIKAQIGLPGYKVLPLPEDLTVRRCVMGFLEWVSEHDVKFLSSERMVYSKKHKYIGTLDIEAMVDGKHCIIDLKTSNNIYNTVRLQLAAYLKADEEERGIKYDGRWVIRMAKESEEEYYARMKKKKRWGYPSYKSVEAIYLENGISSIDNDFNVFLSCKALKEWDEETDFFKINMRNKKK